MDPISGNNRFLLLYLLHSRVQFLSEKAVATSSGLARKQVFVVIYYEQSNRRRRPNAVRNRSISPNQKPDPRTLMICTRR